MKRTRVVAQSSRSMSGGEQMNIYVHIVKDNGDEKYELAAIALDGNVAESIANTVANEYGFDSFEPMDMREF